MAVAFLLLIYGGITTAGGVMGSFHSKTNGSLIAGFASGAALIASGILLLSGLAWGFYLGLAVNVFLIVLLGKRYAKTKGVMPAGMLLGISVVVAGVLFTELFP
jgi:uncharacterized membrane protein (UPF0136 family)